MTAVGDGAATSVEKAMECPAMPAVVDGVADAIEDSGMADADGTAATTDEKPMVWLRSAPRTRSRRGASRSRWLG